MKIKNRNEICIDNDFNRWIPTFLAVENDETPVCPICGGKEMSIIKECDDGKIRCVILTCNYCNLTEHISRR